MNKLLAATLAAFAATVSLGAAAQGATPEQRAAMKQKWDSMTPEQQAAMKEKKAKWDAMTPEQQAEAKKRFMESHPRAAARMAEKQAAASAPK